MTLPDDFKFDSRIRQRMLRRGDLSSADLQAHLERLPDLHEEYEDLNEFTQPALVPARADACEPSPAFDPRRVAGLGGASAFGARGSAASVPVRPVPRPLSPLIPSPTAERARPVAAAAAPAGFGASALDEMARRVPPVVTRLTPAADIPGMDVAGAGELPLRSLGEPGSETEPHTPVTLRSEQASAEAPALDEDEDEDEDEDDDEDDDDDDDDDVEGVDEDVEGESEVDDDDDDDDDDEEKEGVDDDEEPPTNPRGTQ